MMSFFSTQTYAEEPSEVGGSGAVADPQEGFSRYKNGGLVCPRVLKDWVYDDFKDKTLLFGALDFKSEAKSCGSVTETYRGFAQGTGFTSRFSSATQLNDYFKNKLSGRVSIEASNVIDGCLKSLPPDKAKVLVTRFYSVTTKMATANLTYVDELAALDATLGESVVLSGLKCPDSQPDVKARCELYRSKAETCQADRKNGKIEEAVNTTVSAMKEMGPLDRDVLSNDCLNPVTSPAEFGVRFTNQNVPETMWKSDSAICRALKGQRENLLSQISWVGGSEYKASLGRIRDCGRSGRPSPMCDYNVDAAAIKKAIVAQLTADKQALLNAYNKNLDYANCLIGQSDRCNHKSEYKAAGKTFDTTTYDREATAEMRTALNQMPPLEDGLLIPLDPRNLKDINSKDREAATYFAGERCLIERTEDRAKTMTIVSNAARDAILTAGTAGVGIVAGGLIKTGRLLKFMSYESKFSAAGAARTMMTTDSAVALFYTGEVGQRVKAQCGAEIRNLQKSTQGVDADKAVVCPSVGKDVSQASVKLNQCAKVVLLGGANELPLLTGVVSLARAAQMGLARLTGRASEATEAAGTGAKIGAATTQTAKFKAQYKGISPDEKDVLTQGDSASSGSTSVRQSPIPRVPTSAKLADDFAKAQKFKHSDLPEMKFTEAELRAGAATNPNKKHFVSSDGGDAIMTAVKDGKRYFIKRLDRNEFEIQSYLESRGIDLGIRGRYRGANGDDYTVMDFKEGDIFHFGRPQVRRIGNTATVNENTVTQVRQITRTLEEARVETTDFQFLVDRNGTVSLIDVGNYRFMGDVPRRRLGGILPAVQERFIPPSEYVYRYEEYVRTLRSRAAPNP